MAILPISIDKSLCLPFCDYANITSPKENEEAILALLMPFLDILGASLVSEGLYVLPAKGGSFKIYKRGLVIVYSVSGGILERLRANNLLGHFLFVFTEFPHQVSMLHATVDYALDAPKFIQKVYELSHSGDLKISRKAITSKQVVSVISRDDEGNDTGTVYLGDRKNSDIWAKVYDKRKERLDKGFPDCGSMLRLEMAFQTDVGATLKDIQNPHDLYYQYASKSLVKAPKGFKGWVSYAEGFTVEKKQDNLTTWERIWGIVEHSSDLDRIFDLAAADYGDDALQEISKLIRKKFLFRKAKGVVTS